MSDGHISILRTEKTYVTSIILWIFLELLSYWKEKPFDRATSTIPKFSQKKGRVGKLEWVVLKKRVSLTLVNPF